MPTATAAQGAHAAGGGRCPGAVGAQDGCFLGALREVSGVQWVEVGKAVGREAAPDGRGLHRGERDPEWGSPGSPLESGQILRQRFRRKSWVTRVGFGQISLRRCGRAGSHGAGAERLPQTPGGCGGDRCCGQQREHPSPPKDCPEQLWFTMQNPQKDWLGSI